MRGNSPDELYVALGGPKRKAKEDRGIIIDLMNQIGSLGWEMCGHNETRIGPETWFKRPRPATAPSSP